MLMHFINWVFCNIFFAFRDYEGLNMLKCNFTGSDKERGTIKLELTFELKATS